MTVLLDTSVLVAFLNPKDALQSTASSLMRQILAGEFGAPLSVDYVLAEGLTLLRRRPGDPDVSRRFSSLFLADQGTRAPIRLKSTSREELGRAVQMHFDRYERGLSVTDCVIATTAAGLGAAVASFDAGFDGVVPRISAPL